MSKNIHFRRIPDYIEQELRNIQEQHVIVAAIINIKRVVTISNLKTENNKRI